MATVRRRRGVLARALSVAHQDSDRARGLRTEGSRGVDLGPCDPRRSRTDLLDRYATKSSVSLVSMGLAPLEDQTLRAPGSSGGVVTTVASARARRQPSVLLTSEILAARD